MSYRFNDAAIVLSHGIQSHSFVRDAALSDSERRDLDALVASGDCFEALASQVDQVSRNLDPDDPNHYQLEAVITTLINLQRSYKISRKA